MLMNGTILALKEGVEGGAECWHMCFFPEGRADGSHHAHGNTDYECSGKSRACFYEDHVQRS